MPTLPNYVNLAHSGQLIFHEMRELACCHAGRKVEFEWVAQVRIKNLTFLVEKLYSWKTISSDNNLYINNYLDIYLLVREKHT